MKAVLFDLDHTLLDHDFCTLQASKALYEKYAAEIAMPLADFLVLWRAETDKNYRLFLANELTFKDQQRVRIKATFSKATWLEDVKMIDKAFAYYRKVTQQNWRLFDDALPCLQELERVGYQMGIITNGNRPVQKKKIKALKIRRYFSKIITSSDISISKPDPKIFHHACEMMNLPPKVCYFVGDGLETDAIGAEMAGMKGIWLNRHTTNTQTSSKVITINSLAALTKHLAPVDLK